MSTTASSPGSVSAKHGYFAGLNRLFDASSRRRRLQLIGVVALTLVGALAELVTLGAVIPVLAVAAKPGSLPNLPIIGPLLSAMADYLGIGAVVAAAIFASVSAASLDASSHTLHR